MPKNNFFDDFGLRSRVIQKPLQTKSATSIVSGVKISKVFETARKFKIAKEQGGHSIASDTNRSKQVIL